MRYRQNTKGDILYGSLVNCGSGTRHSYTIEPAAGLPVGSATVS